MHKQVESRTQIIMCTLDDLITPDNPVRTLDTVINEVIYKGGIEIPTGKSRRGRRAYSASDLVKLYIYGHINGISSCRDLERTTEINLEAQWLIRNQKPSYKTISDFRKNHASFIREVFKQFVELLKDSELVTHQTWVLDGSKVKANASRDMLSVANLRKQVQELDREIEDLLGEASEPLSASETTQDDDDVPPPADVTAGKELERKLQARAELQSLLSEAEVSGHNYLAPADPEAMLVKTRRGKCAGYNTQLVVDAEHHLIIGVGLAEVEVDNSSLYKMIKAASDFTGATPETILADKGYTNFHDIRKIYDEITTGVRVQVQKTRNENRKLNFRYDREHNQVICPQGHVMVYQSQRLARGTKYYQYICHSCQDCPIKDKCTKSNKGRIYNVAENREFQQWYRELMLTPAAQAAARRRKTIIEHVFGTIAQMMHYNGFKLRGRSKVLTESYLYALAYNFKRLFTLLRGPGLPGWTGKLCPGALDRLFSLLFCVIMRLLRLLVEQFYPLQVSYGH